MSNRQTSRRDFLGGSLALGAAVLAGRCAMAGSAEADSASADEPAKWRIGIYTRPWDQWDYRTALDDIVQAGYREVGLMTAKGKGGLVISVATTLAEAADIGQQCRQRGLKVPSVYGGPIPTDRSLKAGIEGLKQLIDNCAAAGGENLLMAGTGSRELYDRYYQAIGECCDYAASKGVGLSLKPHGGLNASGAECRKIIQSIGKSIFRVWYDPGNILYYSDGKLDPVAEAAELDKLVVGMCVKDYRHPRDVMVTPGSGQVDFAKVLARLVAGGFSGKPLIVETVARGDRPLIIAEAIKARKFVEKLTGQKG